MNQPAPATDSGIGDPAQGVGTVAAVTLDGTGKILSVDDGCSALFGWKGSELVGQHLKVLIKDWPDNHVAKFLQRPRKPDAQLLSLRVTARRMDGREFPATMTRLAWTTDKPVDGKPGGQGSLTAVFREVSANPAPMRPPVPIEYGMPGPSARLEDAPQFQGSVAALRSANEELQKKLEAMSLEAWKKNEALAKAEKEHAEILKRLSVRETELDRTRSQLEGEIAQRKLLDSQVHEATGARSNLEKQLAESNRSRDELSRLATDLRDQLSETKSAAQRAEAAYQQELARSTGLKQAMASLQHTSDALNIRLATEQQLAAESRRRVEELESMLRGTAAEAERANAELEKHTATLSRVQLDAQEQVRTARAVAERAEALYKQELARADRFERDLTALKRAHDDLEARLRTEQQAGSEAKRRVKELETTLRDTTAELERASDLLQKQRGERARLESDWQAQINAAKAAAERAEANSKQEIARASKLEVELATLRQAHAELQEKVASDPEVAAEASRVLRQRAAEFSRAKAVTHATEHFRRGPNDQKPADEPARAAELSDLERKLLREGMSSLARITAEVERERSERYRVEQQFAALSTQMRQIQEELRRHLSAQNSGKSNS